MCNVCQKFKSGKAEAEAAPDLDRNALADAATKQNVSDVTA